MALNGLLSKGDLFSVNCQLARVQTSPTSFLPEATTIVIRQAPRKAVNVQAAHWLFTCVLGDLCAKQA